MKDYDFDYIKNELSLPQDIGPHSFTDMEWWYFFAFLNGENGSKYAAVGAFYQAGELPVLKGHYLIFSLIDLNKYTNHSFSLIDKKLVNNFLYINMPLYFLQCPHDKNMIKLYKTLIHNKLPYPHKWISNASIKKDPVCLIYENSSMRFKDSVNGEFNVQFSSDHIDGNLNFISAKPVSLIGGNGKTDKLYYYSFPRNKVTGYIQKGDSKEYVTGEGWFDHQWGYLGDLLTKTGWNWMGLQLEDGRELLINEFFTIKTGDTFSPMANLIEPNGEVKFTRKLSLEPSNYWHSSITNTDYPLNWIIKISDFKMIIKVSAVFPEQEMQILGPLQAIWEGTCMASVEETKQNSDRVALKGKGFLELVGYNNYKC
ncbi:MAG: lipocalin family protein [Bacillota bacterium]|nr:lipocalin family protein [Bacillota bacterium]